MERGTEIWPRLNMSSSQYQVLCLSKFDNVILCSCNQNVKTFLSSRIPFVSRFSIILKFVLLSQFLEFQWRQKAPNILLCTIPGVFYYFNSTINPVLYSLMSKRLRNEPCPHFKNIYFNKSLIVPTIILDFSSDSAAVSSTFGETLNDGWRLFF